LPDFDVTYRPESVPLFCAGDACEIQLSRVPPTVWVPVEAQKLAAAEKVFEGFELTSEKAARVAPVPAPTAKSPANTATEASENPHDRPRLMCCEPPR
jgi:hypothetical protein